MADEKIFRKAALERLASPDRLDERLALPAYPRPLLVILACMLVLVAGFAAWLLSAR
ncbi:MAG: hypothetical protein ABIR98_01690 [Usitatibacter sp.]